MYGNIVSDLLEKRIIGKRLVLGGGFVLLSFGRDTININNYISERLDHENDHISQLFRKVGPE